MIIAFTFVIHNLLISIDEDPLEFEGLEESDEEEVDDGVDDYFVQDEAEKFPCDQRRFITGRPRSKKR